MLSPGPARVTTSFLEALRWRRIPRNPAAKKPDSAMVIVDGSGVTIPFGPKSAEVEVPAVPKAGPVPNANCTPEKLPSDRTVLVVTLESAIQKVAVVS